MPIWWEPQRRNVLAHSRLSWEFVASHFNQARALHVKLA